MIHFEVIETIIYWHGKLRTGFISTQSSLKTLHICCAQVFSICDPSRQELAGHLRLLIWGDRVIEAQSSEIGGFAVHIVITFLFVDEYKPGAWHSIHFYCSKYSL